MSTNTNIEVAQKTTTSRLEEAALAFVESVASSGVVERLLKERGHQLVEAGEDTIVNALRRAALALPEGRLRSRLRKRAPHYAKVLISRIPKQQIPLIPTSESQEGASRAPGSNLVRLLASLTARPEMRWGAGLQEALQVTRADADGADAVSELCAFLRRLLFLLAVPGLPGAPRPPGLPGELLERAVAASEAAEGAAGVERTARLAEALFPPAALPWEEAAFERACRRPDPPPPEVWRVLRPRVLARLQRRGSALPLATRARLEFVMRRAGEPPAERRRALASASEGLADLPDADLLRLCLARPAANAPHRQPPQPQTSPPQQQQQEPDDAGGEGAPFVIDKRPSGPAKRTLASSAAPEGSGEKRARRLEGYS